MERTCDIGRLLDIECNKLDFCRTVEIKNVSELSREFHETSLWRAELLERKHEININCKHHELLFGSDTPYKGHHCNTWEEVLSNIHRLVPHHHSWR